MSPFFFKIGRRSSRCNLKAVEGITVEIFQRKCLGLLIVRYGKSEHPQGLHRYDGFSLALGGVTVRKAFSSRCDENSVVPWSYVNSHSGYSSSNESHTRSFQSAGNKAVCGEDGRLERRAQKSEGVRERVAVSRRGVLLFHVSLRSESASSGSSAAKAAFGGYLKRIPALKSSSLAPVLWQQQKSITSEKRYTTKTHAIV